MKKAEIEQILKTYDTRKNEFKAWGESGTCFVSQIIKGYMLTLEEQDKRILVNHTDNTGKRTVVDVWERTPKGLKFFCRNPFDKPLMDRDILKDLSEENQRLKDAGRKLQAQIDSIKNNTTINDTVKNKGKVGRPSRPQEKLEQFRTLLDQGKTEKEICQELNMSRPTFFRYKKSIKNNK